jgi:hypothetical protein
MTAVSDRMGWLDAALCLEVGPDLFFEEVQGGAEPAQAKALCRSCEARTACLSWALEARIQDGVFGGFTPRNRRRVARQHKAGKPLEDLIAEDDAEFYARMDRSHEIAVAAAERRKDRARQRYAEAMRRAAA